MQNHELFFCRQQMDPIGASNSWCWLGHTKVILARTSRLLGFSGRFFLSRVSFYRMFLFSQTLSLLDTHFVGQLCLEPPDQPLSGKQSFWDRLGILADKAMVESSLSNEHENASFLAASAPHSGHWLLALHITACGLRLDDEALQSLSIGHDSLCPSHMSMRSSGWCLWCP